MPSQGHLAVLAADRGAASALAHRKALVSACCTARLQWRAAPPNFREVAVATLHVTAVASLRALVSCRASPVLPAQIPWAAPAALAPIARPVVPTRRATAAITGAATRPVAFAADMSWARPLVAAVATVLVTVLAARLDTARL